MYKQLNQTQQLSHKLNAKVRTKISNLDEYKKAKYG